MADESVTIVMTEHEHRELLSLLVHYSTRTDRWAISTGLRAAVASAGRAP